MRAVVQRVARAAVRVDGDTIAAIGPGLLVLVGVGPDDGPPEVSTLGDKLVALRIFPDDENRMNRALLTVNGEIIIVSQFTLFGDVRRGNRPSFTGAAPAREAAELIAQLAAHLRAAGVRVAEGSFGAHMEVESVNDGPVTLLIEVRAGRLI
jgi:D-tyrosyl-tRNA(Tyr) deacylase